MTLPYLFVFLSGCCVAVRSAFGVAAVIGRCMRAYKFGAGEFSSWPQGRAGSPVSASADDLGPRGDGTHGRSLARRTRGSLPDNQEGRHGGHATRGRADERCPSPAPQSSTGRQRRDELAATPMAAVPERARAWLLQRQMVRRDG